MRNFIRNIILNILSLNVSPSKYIHILNGHFVDENLTVDSYNKFEKFIIRMRKYFDIISLEQAIQDIHNKNIIFRPRVALTFDDGLLECYTIIFPLLEKYNLKAAFFINPVSIDNQDDSFTTNFIKNNLRVNFKKKFMTWSMIKEIKEKGHVIGSHTTNHLELNALNEEILTKEIIDSKNIINSRLDINCEYFAFPFGTSNFFDKNAVEMASKTYKYSFTSGSYGKYFFNGRINIFSRRHFEINWSFRHIIYFLSKNRL